MKCVDLFSGCGGLSLGFYNAGIEILASLDNWDKAVEVYKNNFKHPCHLYDLTDEEGTLKIIRNYSPEMIIGGPPCQDFSSAGKRDETLGRADLTYHFANIVGSYKPKWFVMENVERIRKSHILKEISEQLINYGYGLSSFILNASYCGVPQARNRFFMIGELAGKHNQLNKIYLKNLSDKSMTIRDYLGESLNLEFYYRHPRNYSRRGIFSIDEPSPTVRGVNRPVPSGYNKHSGDPGRAILKKVRPLTTIERSYIQTFPKTFNFNGTKTNLEQMIGNAVPVKLAEFVASGILEYLKHKQDENIIEENSLFDKIPFEIPSTALHRSKRQLNHTF
ncbi:DNA (cytosine-5)-methyltransferase 1 [Bathymodiolus japonicus methanotrophic gill symbiont]|uniref:DNA cytosine methyltransferase n=1 Tax=Bathymodiolus japonicus methanotrophic gill symbiont TaxID=113269 RepID=UPI001B503432|nr:DNA cytosine methyltransferase [Bathymodiolus japonicus methanotrophic gill symbiont]GFO73368.1 DNA (cytosine-5)-methyltransferase 1 [Bathymodiolus japonicus methanotrophic gill symbiont]